VSRGQPVAPVGWDHVIIDAPHSQMPLWLAGAAGSAVLVLGAALIAADALGRLAWPLVALGQLALTFYVGHLLALHAWYAALTSREVAEAALIVLALTTIAAGAAVAWRAVLPRGPLEAVLHAPWQMAQRAGAAARRPTSD
jgi:uncharacterized membrane protein YeiB